MDKTNIAVISDTHGLLRAEIIEKIQGTDLIIHAGDIGSPAVLYSLQEIAPVKAVRGNIDIEFKGLPLTNSFSINKFNFFLIHDISQFKHNDNSISVVVYGHSHKSKIENKNGILFINPGSAGPKRFNLPISFGFIEIANGKLKTKIVEI